MKTARWVKTQKRRTIKLTCPVCGDTFNKAHSEYKRNEEKGKNHFCSRKCACIKKNKEYKQEVPESFKRNWGKARTDDCTPFRYYLKKARARKYNIEIDCEYLKELWESQDGKCAISGLHISLKTHSTSTTDYGLTTASLDRIDSSKGYVKDNVQFICIGLNWLKNNRSNEEVIVFLDKLTESLANSSNDLCGDT